MMTDCPDCGYPIPEDAALGLCPACLVSMAGDEDPEELGSSEDRMIGDYRIIRKIGEGGFAIVYEAEQIEPVNRRVALKILKPNGTSPQILARFDAERQALALMDHPNIASIHDAGETGEGDPYFVMELVDGESITTFSERRNLSTEDRLAVLRNVCEAVQHAHLKGVLHRDIKPSNVIVSEVDGRPVPKVIDFGIARALDVSLTNKVLFTEFHQIVGTPSYMSPEQAALDGFPLDGRSDIYGLGILTYETLSGKRPFASGDEKGGSVPELLRRVIEEEPVPLSRHDRSLRGEVEWVVGKAIAKNPDDRYDSAGALARELERVMENRPVEAAAPSNWYRVRKFVRRHRGSVIAGAFAVVALLVGATVSIVQNLRATRLSENLQVRELELRNEFRNSDFKMGLQLAARRRPGDAIAYFCRALRTDPEHHASASCLLALMMNQKFNKLVYPASDYPGSVGTCRFPVVFDDGLRVVCLVDAASPEFSDSTGYNRTTNRVESVQRGENLMTRDVGNPERLAVWEAAPGSFRSFPTGLEEPVRFLIPLGDGEQFALAAGKVVEIRSSTTPEKPSHQWEMDSAVSCLVASSQSGEIIVGCVAGMVTKWNVETGKLSASRKLSDSEVSALAAGREGAFVGYGTSAGEVGIWAVGRSEQTKNSVVHSSVVTAVAMPGSGSHLATGDESGIVHVWRSPRLISLAGPIYHGGAVRVLMVDSAHRKLMSGSDSGFARLWNMNDGSFVPPAQFHRSPVTFGMRTTNAGEFITGGGSGTMRVWSAVDGSGEAFPGAAQISAAGVSSSRHLLATLSDIRRRIGLFEIDREPIWIRRLNPGDGIEHGNEFGNFSPEIKTVKNGDLEVRQISEHSLQGSQPKRESISMRASASILSWALHPNGKQVAALTKGGKIQIWDPRTGEELASPIRQNMVELKALRFCGEEGQLELLLGDGELARLDIPPPEPRLPTWFLVFAEQLGGKRLTEEGEIRNLDQSSLDILAKSLPEAETRSSDQDEVAWRFVRWFLAERAERTAGPSQKMKVGEYVEQLLDTGNPASIQEALRLDPGNKRGIGMLKEHSMPRRPLRFPSSAGQ